MYKRIGVIIIVFAVLIGSIGTVTKACAASTDVTQTIKDRDKINSLGTEFQDFVGFCVFYEMGINEKLTFDFSKSTNRQKMLKYTYWNHGKLNKKQQDKLSKQIFGTSTSKMVKQVIGDWGCSWPKIQISKIYKISGKKYQVKGKLFEIMEEGNKTKKATLIFDLKKDSKGKFGYIVKKLTIKR